MWFAWKKCGLIRNEFCSPTILCGAASERFPRGLFQPNQLAYPVDRLQQSKRLFSSETGKSHSSVPLPALGSQAPSSQVKIIFVPVLVCFSVAMMNTTTQSNLGRRRFILPPRLPSIIQGSQSRDSRYKPGGRNWSRSWTNTDYWLASHALTSSLSYTKQDHLPGLPHISL